ncbi:MAG: c-type cytochrome [Gemmatimonadetes bacterium]|nr:c-type cytochrome [Gemmatimonadota bacterium]
MILSLRTVCVLVLVASACDYKSAAELGLPVEPPPPPPSLDEQVRNLLLAIPQPPPLSPQDPAMVALGQALLFDKILSGNRDISCATCHFPTVHGGDGLSLSIGTGGIGLGPLRTVGAGRQFIPRSSPSLLNQGLLPPQVFWDGRVSGNRNGPFNTPAGPALPPGLPNILAAQAMFPVLNRQEMRGQIGDKDVFGNPNELAAFTDAQMAETWQAIMQRVRAIPEYVTRFAAAFPGIPSASLGFQHAATAMAAFEIQAFSRLSSPFDRYLARDNAAMTVEQKRGAQIFFSGRGGCARCHGGPLLGGTTFANVGIPQIGPGTSSAPPLDVGRANFTFRAPMLRNVELTAPYMHNGAYATLEAVVRHYNDASNDFRSYDPAQLAAAVRPQYHGDQATKDAVLATLDNRVRNPLNLAEGDMADLVTFLKALTDPAARDLGALIPSSVPSGLPIQ